ncbi:MAG: hypothetical protein AAGF67_08210, partial [Verrucomicrobiota bacterium]
MKASTLLLPMAVLSCLVFLTPITKGEETVTIPMSTYKDLMNRLDSLEKRMNESEARDRKVAAAPAQPVSTYTAPASKNSILDEAIQIP